MIDNIPLPVTDNPLDAAFWAGTRCGELRVQFCAECSEARFPPSPRCPHCHSRHSQWRQVGGQGTIWSWVVPRPPLLPAFQARSPYLVAVVALAELPKIRMVGELCVSQPELQAALDGSETLINCPVRAQFRAVSDDVSLVVWELVSQT